MTSRRDAWKYFLKGVAPEYEARGFKASSGVFRREEGRMIVGASYDSDRSYTGDVMRFGITLFCYALPLIDGSRQQLSFAKLWRVEQPHWQLSLRPRERFWYLRADLSDADELIKLHQEYVGVEVLQRLESVHTEAGLLAVLQSPLSFEVPELVRARTIANLTRVIRNGEL